MKKVSWPLAAVFAFGLAAWIVFGLYLTSRPSLIGENRTFPITAPIGLVFEEEGNLVFRFEWSFTRMLIASDDPELAEVMRGAQARHAPISIKAHLDGARIGKGDYPDFWVESLEIGEKHFGPYPARSSWSWRRVDEHHASLLRAIALFCERRTDEAMVMIDRSLEGDRLSPEQSGMAHGMRGTILFVRAQGVPWAERKPLLTRALADFSTARELMPYNQRAHLQLADTLIELGSWEKAVDALDQVHIRWPDDVYLPNMKKGWALRSLGRYEEALAAFDEIDEKLDIDPGPRFHFERGWMHSLLGHYADAIADYDAGLAAEKRSAWAMLARGCTRAANGDFGAAAADARQAATLDAQPGQAKVLSTGISRENIESAAAYFESGSAQAGLVAARPACIRYLSPPAQGRAVT